MLDVALGSHMTLLGSAQGAPLLRFQIEAKRIETTAKQKGLFCFDLKRKKGSNKGRKKRK